MAVLSSKPKRAGPCGQAESLYSACSHSVPCNSKPLVSYLHTVLVKDNKTVTWALALIAMKHIRTASQGTMRINLEHGRRVTEGLQLREGAAYIMVCSVSIREDGKWKETQSPDCTRTHPPRFNLGSLRFYQIPLRKARSKTSYKMGCRENGHFGPPSTGFSPQVQNRPRPCHVLDVQLFQRSCGLKAALRPTAAGPSPAAAKVRPQGACESHFTVNSFAPSGTVTFCTRPPGHRTRSCPAAPRVLTTRTGLSCDQYPPPP